VSRVLLSFVPLQNSYTSLLRETWVSVVVVGIFGAVAVYIARTRTQMVTIVLSGFVNVHVMQLHRSDV